MSTDDNAPQTSDWGAPRFAGNFPRHPELDALVAAFARGDYRTVREGAPKLARETTDERVKDAATMLRERIEPDPASKVLFLFAGLLLAFLTVWWVTHDGPDDHASPTHKTTQMGEHEALTEDRACPSCPSKTQGHQRRRRERDPSRSEAAERSELVHVAAVGRPPRGAIPNRCEPRWLSGFLSWSHRVDRRTEEARPHHRQMAG